MLGNDDYLILQDIPTQTNTTSPTSSTSSSSSSSSSSLSSPTENPATQQPNNTVTARFVSIPVTAIDRCDLFCDYFEVGTAPMRVGEHVVQPTGLIKSVTAQIVFRTPVHIDPRCLIAKTPRFTSFASRETKVEIGLIDTTGEISLHSTGNRVDLHRFHSGSDQHQYTVQVPLIYSRFIQPQQMPLVDRIETKGHFVLHYTLSIPGVVWPGLRETEYKIRLKIVQTLPLAEVVSISSSFFDIPRVEEAWSNFKDWVSSAFSKKPEEETALPNAPELQEADHDHPSSPNNPAIQQLLGDQEYYLKVLETPPQSEAYSMPPPMTYGGAYPPTQQPIFPTQALQPFAVKEQYQPVQVLDDPFFATQ